MILTGIVFTGVVIAIINAEGHVGAQNTGGRNTSDQTGSADYLKRYLWHAMDRTDGLSNWDADLKQMLEVMVRKVVSCAIGP